MIGGENSRTGKIEAERIIKYREEKIRQKVLYSLLKWRFSITK